MENPSVPGKIQGSTHEGLQLPIRLNRLKLFVKVDWVMGPFNASDYLLDL